MVEVRVAGFPIYRFKYFPEADYVQGLITEGTLKFSYPFTDFNDPFDCSPHVYLGGFDNFKRQAKIRGVKIKVKKLRRNFRRATKNILDGGLPGVGGRFGVCCVSRDPFNLLMWAHYASDHKGVLVVFKFDGFMAINDEPVFPMPVEYVDERPSLSLWDGAAEVEKWNLTKGKCWEYEQEERMFVLDQPDGIYKIDRKAHLEAIVIGARATPEFKSGIKASAQKARVELGVPLPVFQAELSLTSYAIEVPRFSYKPGTL